MVYKVTYKTDLKNDDEHITYLLEKEIDMIHEEDLNQYYGVKTEADTYFSVCLKKKRIVNFKDYDETVEKWRRIPWVTKIESV